MCKVRKNKYTLFYEVKWYIITSCFTLRYIDVFKWYITTSYFTPRYIDVFKWYITTSCLTPRYIDVFKWYITTSCFTPRYIDVFKENLLAMFLKNFSVYGLNANFLIEIFCFNLIILGWDQIC